MRIRTVRARLASERWSLKAIQEIVATPDQTNPKDPTQKTVRQERHTQGVRFGAKLSRSTEAAEKEARAPATEDSAQLPRNFRIIDAHLEKFGYTPECLGCEAKRLGIPKRVHSSVCRLRSGPPGR